MNPSKATPKASEASPELTGDERRQLVEALLAAFDEDGLEQLARFRLDVDLAEVAGGDNLRDVAFDLVEWAAQDGRTPALVEGALAERPGNQELLRFEREVWKKPRRQENKRRFGIALAETKRSEPREARSEDGPWWKVTEKVLVPLVVADIGAGGLGWLAYEWLGPEPIPGVVVTNAVLQQSRTSEQGEVLDIGYEIVLTNMEDKSVRVEAVVLDAATRQPIRLSSAPTAQQVTANYRDVRANPTITVPFPWDRGCIVVRVAPTDRDGEALDATTTAAFDPYDPANRLCPMASATTSVQQT